jgi:phenylalanyl-tRNA synthetase beta chain
VKGADGPPRLLVTPPPWRPDLQQPADLDEEVIRLEGYDAIPSVLPRARAGRGLTKHQRMRRRAGQVLAHAGYVEAPCYPFVGRATWEALGIGGDDPRRRTLRLANALSDEEPELRTTLLPGLLTTLRRNESRGLRDVGLFEIGLVFLPGETAAVPPRPSVTGRPTAAELKALDDALPEQPWHLAVVVAGQREPAGWWGPARTSCWADALEAARAVGRGLGVEVVAQQARRTPWHPGRCAQLEVAGLVVGYAGELHPRSVSAFGLPERTAAMEIDLSAVLAAAPDVVPAPRVSPYPVATQDVALVVESGMPASQVESALRKGGGVLLESLRLFDVYQGDQVGANQKSLAYTLRFRAPDRTLTADEVTALRVSAVEEATRRTGAVLRGT